MHLLQKNQMTFKLKAKLKKLTILKIFKNNVLIKQFYIITSFRIIYKTYTNTSM